MKIIPTIALLSGLGMLAATGPAAASLSVPAEQDIRAGTPVSIQFAQANQTRAINEQRGGDYGAKKKKKKKKK